jgi:hypothetical protein
MTSEGSHKFSIELETFDDGHAPGGTAVPTRIARYHHKHSQEFVSIFDNLLPDEWCNRAYQFAVERKKPWGNHIQ